ncbi:MAG: PAS domain S-box protein, partial [Proteobacteria bacterium]|nr:PAS domain S-box protein [Pseudomonadota bacterium]MBU1610293.1 PAS domain S-box protein [Pseudomonadota bacterium]
WALNSRLRVVRESESMHREMVEQSGSIMLLAAEDGTLLFMNRFALDFFGYESHDILGKNIVGTIIPTQDSKGNDMNAMWSEIVKNPDKYRFNENENLRRDGERVWVAWTNKVLPKGLSGGKEVLSVGTDFSAHRQLELDLKEARNHARAAARVKSMLLANITHEIRTPLNGVLGMLQILQMSALDEKQSDNVITAMDSAMDLAAIIDAILKYSEIDSGDITISPQPFSLFNLLQGIRESYRIQAQKGGLELKTATAPGTVDGLVGDGMRLRQLMDILVGNALKFTPEGVVRVEVATQEDGSADGLLLRVEVFDTGIGIPENMLASVLDGFSQADQFYSRRFGGLGMGLAMARRIVEILNGTLTLESREGEGTTVRVEMPMTRMDCSTKESSPEISR